VVCEVMVPIRIQAVLPNISAGASSCEGRIWNSRSRREDGKGRYGSLS